MAQAVDDAMPVEVAGPPHLRAQVTAWIDTHLGWQVTDGGHLPPVVRLAAVAAPGVQGDEVPTILLVGPDDDAARAAARARTCAGVVAWPADHGRLADVVASVLGDRMDAQSSRDRSRRVEAANGVALGGAGEGRRLVVGAAAGGVGATTVALVLAAWQVWRRDAGRCLAVVSGAVPVPDVGAVAPAVLAGHRAWAAGTPVPDLPGLHVTAAAATPDDLRAPDGAALVWERGVVGLDEAPCDVLVARRDRAGLAAAAASTSPVVVVADQGAVAVRSFRDACEGRHLVVVPWSARVARTHARQRVPSSLPGSWSSLLRDVALG